MSFARNVHFTVKNGKVDEFNRLMNTEVLPLVKTASGKGRMRYLSRKAVLDGFGSREGAWRLLGEAPVEPRALG